MPVIFPTKACNLRCSHCMRAEFPEGDMSPHMMKKFMMDMEKLEGHRFHTLTGGEPTMHSDFESIIKVFKDLDHYLSIVTNGISEDGMRILAKYRSHVSFVNISFDSPTEELNDEVRGKGSFKKAMKSLHYLQDSGVQVVPVFVVHDNNAHLVDEIFEFVKKHKMTGAVIIGLHVTETAVKHELVAEERSMTALHRFYELTDTMPGITFNSRYNVKYLNPEWSNTFCGVLDDTLKDSVLTPDGNLWLCCDFVDLSYHDTPDGTCDKHYSPIIGNIRTNHVKTLLNKKKAHSRKLFKQRALDATSGKLINGREYMCGNCKFYHFHKK